ncbi:MULTISPECIES: phosphotransferase [Microbacterium]|uniref:phosphotransferase n=1 Tax=Microbacterium TaxID=33882 RepID=UPI0013A56F3F|nr:MULTISPECIES: phosphotransferase [Microbacterium]
MHAPPAPPEADMLRDALELAPDAGVRLVSREPLGSGSVTGFEVTDPRATAEPGSPATGVTYFVDTSRRAVERETGFATGPSDAPDARVWLHPADPHLPALAPVAFADAASVLLARLGLAPSGRPVFVAYRPGRRGVVRVPTATGDAWIKVLPPSRTAQIVGVHSAFLHAGIPLPAIHGWSRDGLLVLAPAAGAPVAEALDDAEALLDEVDALRGRVAAVAVTHEARTGLKRRLDWYASRLGEYDAAFGALERRVRAAWREAAPTTVIHGDLHFGQLFQDDDGRLTGVIDVDTAGVGVPADDTAAFLAHAVASAVLTPAPRDGEVWALARAALRRWDDEAGRAQGFRARAATHLLGHALGAAEMRDDERAAALLRAAASVIDQPADTLGP